MIIQLSFYMSVIRAILNAVQEILVEIPVQDIIAFCQSELLNAPSQPLQLLLFPLVVH